MRFQEINERCWSGYQQQGMKKKGDRMVPNCVPVEEVKTGPEMTLNDLLYTAAAKAMHQAGLEGQPMDYEEAIKKAAKIYRIPYTPSELPRLLAQRAEIDRKLAMLKQGKQIAKARRKEKLAPTPAGSEEWFKTHSPTVDRIKPPAKTLEETEAELAEDLKKWFKEKWVRFGPDGKIRGDCARGSSKEGKPKCLPQSKAHALGKKGRAAAAAKKRREDPNPERRGPARNVATKVKEDISSDTKSLFQNIIALEYLAKNKEFDSTMFGIKIGTSYFVPQLFKALENFETRYGNQGSNILNQMRQVVYPKLDVLAKGRNYQDSEFDKIVLFLFNNHKEIINDFQQLAQKQISNKEVQIDEAPTTDYDDADEFGMPGSEFFSDDDRLRDGDYVRDSQDGEYGEIFRMSGDPSERRVRILDRDGKGWYISPERLVTVDRNDPDIMKYFGKRRQRDMDEGAVADALENYLQVTGENDVEAVKSAIQKIARDTSLKPTAKARLLGQVGMMIKTHKLPIGREYYQYMQQFMEDELQEKQDACYRKVKSRYKVWPSAYASGALVQCRKKGAANWGNKTKK